MENCKNGGLKKDLVYTSVSVSEKVLPLSTQADAQGIATIKNQ